MIVEKRTYTLKPGKAELYKQIYEKYGLEPQTRILKNMFGWFVPEIGELNQIVHMWAYKDLADRTEKRAALGKDKDWAEFLKHLRAEEMVVHQETQILNAAPWCPNQDLK
ncbi:MAG: NIPSNAP family protein [Rhodospirillales bacterium]|jgi:hypothetical protein